MGAIAFGFHRNALRRILLFYLLSMALGGVAIGTKGGAWGILSAAAGVAALCFFGFRGRLGKEFLPVSGFFLNRFWWMHRTCIPYGTLPDWIHRWSCRICTS